MTRSMVRVRHVYQTDAAKFEDEVNEALRRIVADDGIVGDIKYATDPPSAHHAGGYGALILYEERIEARGT